LTFTVDRAGEKHPAAPLLETVESPS
jgi:hypothetical protein